MLGAAVFILLMAGLFIPLEAWFPVRERAIGRNVALTALGLFLLNLGLMELLGARLLGVLEDAFASEEAPTLLKVLAVLALADLAGYWVHRLMHRVPLLWRFHSVHHARVGHRDARLPPPSPQRGSA